MYGLHFFLYRLYVMAIYKNGPVEAILIGSNNICFYGELMTIMQKISYYLVNFKGFMDTDVFTL